MKSFFLVFYVLIHLSLQAQSRHVFPHSAMGTKFTITISAADTSGLSAVIRKSFARIDALEQSMSDYRADSELNRLTGNTGWQRVSSDLYTVLRFSRKLARRSGGAFDPTIGPLTKLWRRAFRQQEFPEERDISRARSRVQWRGLKARRGRIRLLREDMQLDLGGVAKGYALDVVGRLLREAGFPAFIVDGGGDLLLGDPPDDQPQGWLVAFAGSNGKQAFHNVAVATSGDTYRYLEHKGERYSHIIDPRTGYGVTGRAMVTVIGPSAMVADGLASAASIDVAGDWFKRYRPYKMLGK